MFALFCVILRCKGTTKIRITQIFIRVFVKFRQLKNSELWQIS